MALPKMTIAEARAHADREIEIREELRELQMMMENQDYRTKTEKSAIGNAIQEKRAELNAHLGIE
jgi:hypothetical protein